MKERYQDHQKLLNDKYSGVSTTDNHSLFSVNAHYAEVTGISDFRVRIFEPREFRDQEIDAIVGSLPDDAQLRLRIVAGMDGVEAVPVVIRRPSVRVYRGKIFDEVNKVLAGVGFN